MKTRSIVAALAAAYTLGGATSVANAGDMKASGQATGQDAQAARAQLQGGKAMAPQVKTSGAIKYVSGGIGDEEQKQIKAMGNDFNLAVTFAKPTGAYLGAANLEIRDQAGKTLLETETRGPLFYAELPPGKYTVAASAQNATGAPEQTQTVQVAATGQKAINFAFPAPGSGSNPAQVK